MPRACAAACCCNSSDLCQRWAQSAQGAAHLCADLQAAQRPATTLQRDAARLGGVLLDRVHAVQPARAGSRSAPAGPCQQILTSGRTRVSCCRGQGSAAGAGHTPGDQRGRAGQLSWLWGRPARGCPRDAQASHLTRCQTVPRPWQSCPRRPRWRRRTCSPTSLQAPHPREGEGGKGPAGAHLTARGGTLWASPARLNAWTIGACVLAGDSGAAGRCCARAPHQSIGCRDRLASQCGTPRRRPWCLHGCIRGCVAAPKRGRLPNQEARQTLLAPQAHVLHCLWSTNVGGRIASPKRPSLPCCPGGTKHSVVEPAGA